MNDLQDFERFLEDKGQEISNISQLIAETMQPYIQDMIRRAPVRTGALVRSIGYTVVDNTTISFNMLDYGVFQNYGVSGTQDNLGRPVPFGVEPEPRGTFYQFRQRRFGLPAQTFFNVDDLRTQIVEDIENKLAQE